ncbi:hypothetical protein B0H17DRAFT_1145133 [Mycena rosella]|uniref:Uncharacterized protein n=1 Tax=Mycena rosella TaxID=1033263 RepID=A0AAD7CRU2_MYCRO|nr:hypothetical protein B0H17DRAFT_1145133 [Mycena rosella]
MSYANRSPTHGVQISNRPTGGPVAYHIRSQWLSFIAVVVSTLAALLLTTICSPLRASDKLTTGYVYPHWRASGRDPSARSAMCSSIGKLAFLLATPEVTTKTDPGSSGAAFRHCALDLFSLIKIDSTISPSSHVLQADAVFQLQHRPWPHSTFQAASMTRPRFVPTLRHHAAQGASFEHRSVASRTRERAGAAVGKVNKLGLAEPRADVGPRRIIRHGRKSICVRANISGSLTSPDVAVPSSNCTHLFAIQLVLTPEVEVCSRQAEKKLCTHVVFILRNFSHDENLALRVLESTCGEETEHQTGASPHIPGLGISTAAENPELSQIAVPTANVQSLNVPTPPSLMHLLNYPSAYNLISTSDVTSLASDAPQAHAAPSFPTESYEESTLPESKAPHSQSAALLKVPEHIAREGFTMAPKQVGGQGQDLQIMLQLRVPSAP